MFRLFIITIFTEYSHTIYIYIFFFLPWRIGHTGPRPLHYRGFTITQTHNMRLNSSERVISSTQRPLPDNKQHSKATDIHVSDGIGTHNPSKQAAADPHPRLCGHWDRLRRNYTELKFSFVGSKFKIDCKLYYYKIYYGFPHIKAYKLRLLTYLLHGAKSFLRS